MAKKINKKAILDFFEAKLGLDWPIEKYVSVVKGDKEFNIPSLRSVVKGFDAKDGFDIRHADEWTSYEKRKIREAYDKVNFLQAQPKRIVRARGKNLEKLKRAFHGNVPSDDFKVAFVPDLEPDITLPGAKKNIPKIRYLKGGVSIKRKGYERVVIYFDKNGLAVNAEKEIKRAAKEMPGAKLYFIQAGQFETLNGRDITTLTNQVKKWMAQYDGVKPIPRGSGNFGNNPEKHHWSIWMNGLVGYVPLKKQNLIDIQRDISKGMKKNRELRKKRADYINRKGRKGRK